MKALLVGGKANGQWREIQNKPYLEVAIATSPQYAVVAFLEDPTASTACIERAGYRRHDLEFGTFIKRTIYVAVEIELVDAMDMLLHGYSATDGAVEKRERSGA